MPSATDGPVQRSPTRRPLPAVRRIGGLALTVIGLPLLAAVLVPLRGTLSLPSQMLLFLLLVVGVALLGGVLPAVLAAVAGFLLINWFFIPPYGTLSIAQRDHVLALIVFVAVAVTVSVLVEFAAASAARAARSEAEAEIVARLAEEAPAEIGLASVLRELRATFPLVAVRVEQRDVAGGWDLLAQDAEPGPGDSGDRGDSGDVRRVLAVPGDPGLRLVLIGPPLFAEDSRLLTSFAGAVGTAVRAGRLAEQAADAERLAAAESLRTALLAAVGHDLRTPLSGIKAAVSTLRQSDISWSTEQQAELHATIEESADQLGRILANLLDLSRLEAGSVRAVLEPVVLDGAVAEAVRSAGSPPVQWEIPDDLPVVRADPGLLERAVANLVANAMQHGGASAALTLRAGPDPVPGGAAGPCSVSLQVVDHGPGVGEADLERIFAPFQRLDDHGRGEGLGLGLAVARGFVEAMGGEIGASPTPGGGLTVRVRLPLALPAGPS